MTHANQTFGDLIAIRVHCIVMLCSTAIACDEKEAAVTPQAAHSEVVPPTPPPAAMQCVDDVPVGDEWFLQSDPICGDAKVGTAPPPLDASTCRLLQRLRCSDSRRLEAPDLWRLRRALTASTLSCTSGPFPMPTCPPPGTIPPVLPSLPQLGPLHDKLRLPTLSTGPLGPSDGAWQNNALDRRRRIDAVDLALARVHATAGTSEYDSIDDAYHHLADGDVRGDAIVALVGRSRSMTTAANSCASMNLAEMSSLEPNGPDPYCGGAPFYGDLRFDGTSCSGFVLEGRYLVTAGHCVSHFTASGSSDACKGVPAQCVAPGTGVTAERAWIVHHFARDASGGHLDALGCTEGMSAELVGCEVAVDSGETRDLARSDWAVFRLPPDAQRSSLSVTATSPTTGTSAHMLSHMAGLPLKHSGDGQVLATSSGPFGRFEVTVDGYSGSSGAPVFDSSGSVLGIFVSQDSPGVESCADCIRLPICPAKDCATRPLASVLTGALAAIKHDKDCLSQEIR